MFGQPQPPSMGSITDGTVFIQDETLDEATARLKSGMDPEINVLDPTVGTFFSPVFYSIRHAGEAGAVHIGSCCLYNYTGNSVEYGIRIWNRDHWGRGYGTRATNLMCEFIFKSSKVFSIMLKARIENTRAIKCYEKCGFKHLTMLNIDGYLMDFMSRERR